MQCAHLVLRQNEVTPCKMKGTYLLIDKQTREVVETLCTTHAEKLIFDTAQFELYYTRLKRMSC